MGLTIAPNPSGTPVGGMTGQSESHLQFRMVDVTFDSSMAAGGETITPAHVGLTTIYGVIEVGADTPSGYVFKYDNDDNKITAYQSYATTATTNSAQALAQASTADISATPVRFLVIGA